jgi:hypothetical protein
MDFDFNDLSGSLPTELYILTDLVQLDLNNNRLTGTVDQLGVFLDLEFLQLDGTHDTFIGSFLESAFFSSILTCAIRQYQPMALQEHFQKNWAT